MILEFAPHRGHITSGLHEVRLQCAYVCALKKDRVYVVPGYPFLRMHICSKHIAVRNNPSPMNDQTKHSEHANLVLNRSKASKLYTFVLQSTHMDQKVYFWPLFVLAPNLNLNMPKNR